MRYWGLLLLVLTGCSRSGPTVPDVLYDRLLSVRSLTFSSDGKTLVAGRSLGSGATDADLLIWTDGNSAPREVPAHPGDVVCVCFAGTKLVSAGADGSIKNWDTTSWTARDTFPGPRWIAAMEVIEDGQAAILLRGGGRHTFQPRQAQLEFRDLQTGTVSRTVSVASATALKASDDGQRVATVNTDGSVTLWSGNGTSTGRLAGPVTCLDVAADGKSFVTGNADGIVTVSDWDSQKAMQTFPALPSRVTAVAFAPGERVFCACDSKIMGGRGGKPLWEQAVDGYSSPGVIAFAPTGSQWATAGASKVLLWTGP